ncbi:REP-associated tyrosine transposase [Aquimonas sp.]|jgi:putative transposase|uniref:REP-associated tyrosine transposase n=1 Tax=Aquimonas sp. TaxID=1872588 RepID=UPI0037BE22C5
MPNYRRLHTPGATCFFTVNLWNREQSLLVDHITLLREAFRATRTQRSFELVAAVVLPDHLHCLWSLPEDDADNATRWRQIKTVFSRGLPLGESLSPSRSAKGERGIWQRRYYERLILDERDLHAHIDYIHYNPVKHGYAERARDWPHSSFHRHVRDGLLAPDWGNSIAG